MRLRRKLDGRTGSLNAIAALVRRTAEALGVRRARRARSWTRASSSEAASARRSGRTLAAAAENRRAPRVRASDVAANAPRWPAIRSEAAALPGCIPDERGRAARRIVPDQGFQDVASGARRTARRRAPADRRPARGRQGGGGRGAHAGAARARRRRSLRALRGRQEPPRRARLRRPDRPHAATCSAARPMRPGCSTSSTGASTTSSSTRPRTPASPQWGILRALTEDFTPATGRSERVAHPVRGGRSQAVDLLLPGRGAGGVRAGAPRASAKRSGTCESRRPATLAFHERTLQLSFRSAPDVLRAVDAVFFLRTHFRGLSVRRPGHDRARERPRRSRRAWWRSGRSRSRPPAPEPDAWDKPLDEPDAASPAVRLARANRADRRGAGRPDGDEDGRSDAARRRADPGAQRATPSSRR